MGQVLVRNVDDELKDRLKELARENGRSLEAEVRARLRDSVDSDESAIPTAGPDPNFWRDYANGERDWGFTAEDIERMEAWRRPPLVLDNLHADVRAFWEERATANGHTLNEEVNALLTEKARWFRATGKGFGSQVVRLFRDDPFEPGEIQERPLRGFLSPDFGDEE